MHLLALTEVQRFWRVLLQIVSAPFRWLLRRLRGRKTPAFNSDDRPWYEGSDGSCTIQKPTLMNMGQNQQPHLLYPVHWSQALEVLPQAKSLASQRHASLVLLIYGTASDSEVASLIVELAETQVLPLWIGEANRKQFDKVISMLAGQEEH